MYFFAAWKKEKTPLADVEHGQKGQKLKYQELTQHHLVAKFCKLFLLKSCSFPSFINPENINSVGSTNKPQSTIVKFGK